MTDAALFLIPTDFYFKKGMAFREAEHRRFFCKVL